MNAPLDENSRKGITCALNTDGKTITDATVDPSTHALRVKSDTGQADNGNHGGNALIDDNGRSSWYGLASDASGERIIVYCDSTGAVLTEST